MYPMRNYHYHDYDHYYRRRWYPDYYWYRPYPPYLWDDDNYYFWKKYGDL